MSLRRTGDALMAFMAMAEIMRLIIEVDRWAKLQDKDDPWGSYREMMAAEGHPVSDPLEPIHIMADIAREVMGQK